MKQYIADLIKRKDYVSWLKGKKVGVFAPTGMGKSSFIIYEVLQFCSMAGKKILILCNRTLLHRQYDFDIAEIYERYIEFIDDVEIATYQEIAEKVKNGADIRFMFDEYDVIICDEIHYFYADSDFNSFGTYVLLQAIIRAGYFKTMVFMTATPEEVLPLLENTFKKCKKKVEKEERPFDGMEEYHYVGQIYDFIDEADYSRFNCCYSEDVESIVNAVAKSGRKSVWFIDDKTKAEKIKKMLCETDAYTSSDIIILNSKIIEEGKEEQAVRKLVAGHKVPGRVLITTSVLDNGVSIHDPDVGSVVIATESKVSFLQMIGRIRAEKTEECNLFIFPRSIDYYQKRVNQYNEKIDAISECRECISKRDFQHFLQGWYGRDDKSEWIRNYLVLTRDVNEYYSENLLWYSFQNTDCYMTINAFAEEKTGNMLLSEKRFLKLASEDPKKVAIHQFAWLGKSEDEITFLSSTYKEERKEELKKELLKIQDYTKEEFQKSKNKIVAEYKKDILKNLDIQIQKDTMSSEKFKMVCDWLDLELLIYPGKSNLRNVYTVVKKGESEDKTCKRPTVFKVR